MIMTTPRWRDRCTHLAAMRDSNHTSDLVPVGADELIVGDRFVWGGTRTLTITTLVDDGDLFIAASCSDGEGEHVALDLHRREEVLVMVPRPPTTQERTR